MLPKITLKKYPNRRLYDTENSRYVTLGDVGDMIRKGRHVEVVDVKSGQDVTAFILTQIMMDRVKKNNSLLPVSLLHLIIRFGEDILSEFFDNYLEKIIQSYLSYRKTTDEQFRIYLELGMDFSKIAKNTMNPFPSFFERPSDQSDKKNDDET